MGVGSSEFRWVLTNKAPDDELGRHPVRPRGFRATSLDGGYLHRLGAFGALGDLELHSLILFERTEAATLNLGMVDEHILCAVVRCDKAKALFAIEPFHSSLCHSISLSFQVGAIWMHLRMNLTQMDTAAATRCAQYCCPALTSH
jgi:hypothetical protein